MADKVQHNLYIDAYANGLHVPILIPEGASFFIDRYMERYEWEDEESNEYCVEIYPASGLVLKKVFK